MSELYEVKKSIEAGEYDITYKYSTKDVDGKNVDLPCNEATKTEAQLDDEIVRAEHRVADAQITLDKLLFEKAEIGKLKEVVMMDQENHE